MLKGSKALPLLPEFSVVQLRCSLVKQFVNPGDLLNMRAVVDHLVPNCALDEWNCHHMDTTSWNVIKLSAWMMCQPCYGIMSMFTYFKILITFSPTGKAKSFKISFNTLFWNLWKWMYIHCLFSHQWCLKSPRIWKLPKWKGSKRK